MNYKSNFKIVPTPPFERELKHLAKKYRSIKNDLAGLVALLQQDAFVGEELGNDCYKIRMAISAKNKGKSAGARLITHIHVKGPSVYLISIYDKSEQASISTKELLLRLKNLQLPK